SKRKVTNLTNAFWKAELCDGRHLSRPRRTRREVVCKLRKSRDCRTKQIGVYLRSRTKRFQPSQPLRRRRIGVGWGFASLFGLVVISSTTFAQTPTPTATGTPAATATPSPTASECPRPTPGTCVSYEAEDNTLTGSAFVLDCPTCSGGFKVGY